MCGICAIISKDKFPVKQLQNMNDIIQHRGPDDEGFFFVNQDKAWEITGGKDTPGEVFNSQIPYTPQKIIGRSGMSHSKIGLGHRRLSILDLSPSGHLPMSYANNRYWITYNGEVYNYLELKEELSMKGHQFLTGSDTEVILAAYAEWGTTCLDRFNGMWSFIIYDRELEVIFAARDRYGIKPLYYWLSPSSNLHFASEIKQFTTIKDWIPRMNGQRVADYLNYAVMDHTNETMFDGVFHIPPGHYFKSRIIDINFRNSQLTIAKWYKPKRNTFKGSFEEATDEFRRLFKKAIDLHLRSDVPLGSALSGGLDSSAIVCEVNSILRSQGAHHLQKTFSSCSDYKEYDERKWMDKVINHTEVEAHFTYPKLERLFELTPQLIWFHDEPYQSQATYLGYHVFELAKKNGVKVLLNGQGADEYLGGYGQLTTVRYTNLIKQLKWGNLLSDINETKAYRSISYKSALRDVAYDIQPTSVKRFLAGLNGGNKIIKSLINFETLGASDLHPHDVIPVGLSNANEISTHNLFYNPLCKYLKWEDRNSMANSIEARVPFLDHRLVEFCCSLNEEYIEKNGQNKRVLREGLKGILPESIRTRKDKKGFITPEEKWVKNENNLLFRTKIQSAVDKSNGIINSELIQYFDKIVEGEIPFDYTYWRFILFSEWLEKFGFK